MTAPYTVFDFLDEIRRRPGMFVTVHTGADLLADIESLLHGYYVALDHHGIIEPVPHMGDHFRTWVHVRTGLSCSAGWAYALRESIPDPAARMTRFFGLVAEYRTLTRRLVATNSPEGKDESRVDLYFYEPIGLSFTITYKARPVVGWLLMDGSGRHVLSVDDATYLVSTRQHLDMKMWLRA